MRTEKTTIFLDLDGTLVDSKEEILNSFFKAWKEVSNSEPLTANVKVGPPIEDMFIAAGGCKSLESKFQTEFRSHYDSVGCKLSRPYPTVIATIENLKMIGISLYCVTFKPHDPTIKMLESTGLIAHINDVVAIDSAKPRYTSKTKMLANAMDFNGLMADQCLFVGDSKHDHDGANECGVDFVWASYGYGIVECENKIASFDWVMEFI